MSDDVVVTRAALDSLVENRNELRRAHRDAMAEADTLRRQRDELLQALRDLLDNYKYNEGKGLGIGLVAKAKAVLAQYTEDTP